MKVLLVDDEILTINMLKNIVSWKELGIDTVDYALDGITAYEKILSDEPDLVLSDIRMPNMNGLELLQKTSEQKPNIKFILMSAYADFSYIKESMKYGCNDYILKPIDEIELDKSVRKLLHKIQDEKEQEKLIKKSIKSINNFNLYNFMKNNKAKNKALVSWQAFGIYEYRVVLFQIANASIDEYTSFSNIEMLKAGYFVKAIEDNISKYNKKYISFDYEEDSLVCILENDNSLPFENFIKQIHKNILDDLGLDINIYFSLASDKSEEISDLYKQVHNLSKYSFYLGEENILGYGYNCSIEELEKVADIGELKDKPKQNAKYSKAVQESIDIIEEEYASNLSLEDICQRVLLSKNYFSYLFKREVGMSLWSYLIKIRLKKAKELLETSDLKSYEISFKVGYDNPSYFSKIFKKNEGLSPNEYRDFKQKQ